MNYNRKCVVQCKVYKKKIKHEIIIIRALTHPILRRSCGWLSPECTSIDRAFLFPLFHPLGLRTLPLNLLLSLSPSREWVNAGKLTPIFFSRDRVPALSYWRKKMPELYYDYYEYYYYCYCYYYDYYNYYYYYYVVEMNKFWILSWFVFLITRKNLSLISSAVITLVFFLTYRYENLKFSIKKKLLISIQLSRIKFSIDVDMSIFEEVIRLFLESCPVCIFRKI